MKRNRKNLAGMSHYRTYNWGSIFFVYFQGPLSSLDAMSTVEIPGVDEPDVAEIKRLPNAVSYSLTTTSEAEVILGKPPKFNVPWKDSAWLKLLFILQLSLFLSNFLSSLCFPTQSFFTVNRTPGSDTLRSLIPQFTTFIFFYSRYL